MNLFETKLDVYVEEHTEEENGLLKKVNRDTHVNMVNPRMLSGHLQGRILSMLSHMIAPKYILEVGTFTGYSALCLAEGMQEDGVLDTIDVNEELEKRVRGYIHNSVYKGKIIQHIGNALDIIPTLTKKYDLVFLDADKENYLKYYPMLFDKISKGGYIVVDNVLWSGKVVECEKMDKKTQSIIDFNKFVNEDDRVQNVLFPIRDGLMILRKK